jgi:hypothetical protein
MKKSIILVSSIILLTLGSCTNTTKADQEPEAHQEPIKIEVLNAEGKVVRAYEADSFREWDAGVKLDLVDGSGVYISGPFIATWSDSERRLWK